MTPKISFTPPSLDRLETAKNGVIGLFRFCEKRPLTGIAGKIDWRLGGHLSRLLIDDFFSAAPLETLLFPMGHKLFNIRLLIIGLGYREDFNRTVFDSAMAHFLQTADGLQNQSLSLALPGRPEGQLEAADAMEWCLDFLDQHSIGASLTIIEPTSAQPIMTPIVERWRMKHSVAAPAPHFYN